MVLSYTDTIFFGTEGIALSSTSANHIANLAKEFVKGNQRNLSGLHFTEKTVGALGQESRSVLQKGADENALANVETALNEIGEANSLIAWLREGIKAKKDFLEAIEKATPDDYSAWEHKELSEVKLVQPVKAAFLAERGFTQAPVAPTKQDPVSEEEVVDGWEDTDRVRFAYLKSAMEALGSAISGLQGSEQELEDVQDEPVRTSGVGADTLVFQKHPSINLEKLDDTIQSVIELRRSVSNELNAYRRRIAKAILADKAAKQQAYNDELQAYGRQTAAYEAAEKAFDKVLDSYWKQQREIDTALEAYRVNKAKEVGEWKIVIPAALKSIYSKVAALGK